MSGRCCFHRWEKLRCGVRAEEDVVLFGRNHVYCAIGGRVATVAIQMWVWYVYFFVGGVCVMG
jgi:hypothetical protein